MQEFTKMLNYTCPKCEMMTMTPKLIYVAPKKVGGIRSPKTTIPEHFKIKCGHCGYDGFKMKTLESSKEEQDDEI